MGLFDWLRRIFGGTSGPGGASRRRASSEESLRTTSPIRGARRKSAGAAGLDAGQFTGLSDAEVRRRADQVDNFWRNPWFGRTDQIPPASDPRTKLIDQALVGHGLLTADELVEIHKAGEEMAELRPDLAGAAQQAERAVLRSREERAALKQQKKAEAAERKARHAAGVAHRRATDIVYLGRGVSIGLSDRRVNVEKLSARGLPVLATPSDVAGALGLTIPQLRWLAFHSEASRVTHYTRFDVPKKSGGVRKLAAPRSHMAACQQWILGNILARVPVHDAAHGFVPMRSTVTNAAPHVASGVLINVDLRDFFPTITFARVKGLFQGMGYSPAAATILALICTDSPRSAVEYEGRRLYAAVGPRALPQGACTSPALSNLAARNLDARFRGLCAKLGWTYTRYADDLSFSAPSEAAGKVGYLLARVRHIVQDEGFAINEAKTRVLRSSASQRVTGIVVNQRAAVPRRLVRRLRAILHRAKREGLKAQNRQQHPHFESWLRGMLAYVHMVNPDQARPLWEAYRTAGGRGPT